MAGGSSPRHAGNPTRQSAGPSPCFPAPVLLRPKKPASASPRRDPPSCPPPAPKRMQLGSAPRAAPADISVASPREAGGERAGRAGVPVAPPAAVLPAVPPCHPGGLVHGRRPEVTARNYEVATGAGSPIAASVSPLRLRRGSAASFTFSCRCFLTLIPPPPSAPSPPTPPSRTATAILTVHALSPAVHGHQRQE